MRSLTLVWVGLSAFAGIVAINLWLELRSERHINRQLRAQHAQPQPPPGPAWTVVESEPVQPVAVAQPAETPAAGASPAGNALLPPANAVFNSAEMLKDPESREAEAAQMRVVLPQTYPGLEEELGLMREEADKLHDLLTENQLSMTVNPILTTHRGQIDVSALRDSQRKLDDSIASLLGAYRFGQWQEYQQTRPARLQVVQVDRTMESLGQPLTAVQSRHLTAAFAAEQKRQREETRSQYARISSAGPQAQTLEEKLQRQAERNRRIVEAAEPHLTARQIEMLRTTLEQQLAMSRASSVAGQQLGAQGQLSGDSPGASN